MRHLIDPLDFTLEETTKVLDLADRIAESPEVYSHVADGKKIATLFYEPSTRTRLSICHVKPWRKIPWLCRC